MQPVIGILAMQGGVAEHERTLDELGVEHRQIRRPEHLKGLNGIILPGGESTTISKLLQISGLFDHLQAELKNGLPAYGTCAGMIMLAREVVNTRDDAKSLGALDISVKRNAFGRQVDSFEADLDFKGIDEPVPAVFIRAPWIEKTGANVDVLAQVQDGPGKGAIVAVREGNVFATSFHPEVSGDNRVHELFMKAVEEADYTVA